MKSVMRKLIPFQPARVRPT